MKKDEVISAIANQNLGIETLSERKSDEQGFKKVAVGSVKAALEAAYEAGKLAAVNSTKPDFKNSKHQILIKLLRNDTGATLQQMADATGWQKHSVSCALSSVLKTKWKLDIVTIRRAGKECIYRIDHRNEPI